MGWTSHLRLLALEALAPAVARLPRADRFVYFTIGGPWTAPDLRWPYRRIRIRKGWRHRYRMTLDMSHELHRRAFYTGRYYERDVPSLVWHMTRRDDCFVDVGANIGHVSLLAARKVGRTGKIIAFEPNPQTRRLLQANKTLNQLDFVIVRDEALGDADGEGELWLDQDEPGQCTLRDGATESSYTVRIARGETILSDIDGSRSVIIKIDVEGYEMKVLNGLSMVLDRPELAVIVEVTDRWLRQLGSSWEAMRSSMSRLGFTALLIVPVRTWLSPNAVALSPAPAVCNPDEQFNVLFVRLGTAMHKRIAGLICTAPIND
jgi:FkbM family methyltransferase